MHEIVAKNLRNARIQTEFIDANGLQFVVDCCGEGERLALCLHGFPEHSFSWRFQLLMLADLGFKAWAPNLRGYANSSRPEGFKAYRMKHLIEDVAALIDASGCSETVLIAHDWGAVIAWQFALRQRMPLAKLIICNVPHPQAMADAFGWDQLKKSWYVFFFQIPKLPELLFGRDKAKAITSMVRDTAEDKAMFPPEVGEVYRRNAAI
jgi:pimeloyl-ACP methyl ester carboxylesterase